MLDELLPWQKLLWQQMVSNKKLAHAYLFYGKKGVGKHLFAERLAHYWLCLSPINGQPCRQCKSCQLLLGSGAHPDIFHLTPEDSEFIKINQVRALIDFVNQTPQISTCKVVLLEPAEALNLNAANALLKSLEEPAGNSRLILVSHQVGQLLPTIKSRCIQQLCPTPTEDEALLWMREALPNLTKEELSQLWLLAGSAPLYAVELYQQDILAQRELVVADMKKLLKQQVVVSQVVEAWNAVPLLVIFDWFCQWAHAILCFQVTGDKNTLGAGDMQKVLGYLADKSTPESIRQLQNKLLQERQKVLAKANLNRALLLESVLIDWINLL